MNMNHYNDTKYKLEIEEQRKECDNEETSE